MVSSLTVRRTIAVAGLDLLPATRLKVACSLLMAERMDVGVVAWNDTQPDLLVADSTSTEGQQAIRRARDLRMPVMTFSRGQSVPSATSLPHAASVRDIALALKTMLSADASETGPEPAVAHGLLERLRLDAPARDIVLMELGLLRVVVDGPRGRLHMLRRMPIEELVANLADAHWACTPLSEREWKHGYRPDVTSTHSIESLWWRVATHQDIELPQLPELPTQLRAWPDLDASHTPSDWLPALACLLVNAWPVDELAVAAGLSLETARRLVSITQLSGLADTSAHARQRDLRRVPADVSGGTLLRIARRFGLKLFGSKHG